MITRPITLTPDQLRAALAGRLEQIRVPIDHPQSRFESVEFPCYDERGLLTKTHCRFWHTLSTPAACSDRIQSPLGTIGDRLWVREEWSLGLIGIEIGFPYAMIEYKVDGCERFTYISQNIYDKFKDSPDQNHWREADTMPQWASRITLEIIGVRVERLQEMRPCDIQASGCPYQYSGFDQDDAPDWTGWMNNHWTAQHGQRHPWASNPWVWVYSVRKVGE